jgi:hypothetical protein
MIELNGFLDICEVDQFEQRFENSIRINSLNEAFLLWTELEQC